MGTRGGKTKSHCPALGQTQGSGTTPNTSPLLAHTGPLPGCPSRQTCGGLSVISPELTSLHRKGCHTRRFQRNTALLVIANTHPPAPRTQEARIVVQEAPSMARKAAPASSLGRTHPPTSQDHGRQGKTGEGGGGSHKVPCMAGWGVMLGTIPPHGAILG